MKKRATISSESHSKNTAWSYVEKGEVGWGRTAGGGLEVFPSPTPNLSLAEGKLGNCECLKRERVDQYQEGRQVKQQEWGMEWE